MDELERIKKETREVLKNRLPMPEGYKSDQELHKPQPPLVKADMTDHAIELPRNFDDLGLTMTLTEILTARKSSRVYTQENISLLQLSYMLWATQGIKSIRGKKYATLRTVPGGGARHPFETYLIVNHVDGLEPGKYHYLPWGHRIEKLGDIEDMKTTIDTSMVGQTWASKASVVFYWSIVPYRAEWRYGVGSKTMNLCDMGHVGENLYLSATALGLGTCGLGAFDLDFCDNLFGLDGDEEFILYTETIGTVKASDKAEEDAFYQFVYDEGL